MRQRILADVALLLLGALLCASTPALAQDPLSAAKDYYASAEYEKALGVLDEVRRTPGLAPADRLAVEQYRALCLLAVGRKADAEQAIEAVLDLDPFYVPGEDDAAPWVRAAFRDVRRRVLPATLQQRYGRAKQAFERKDYAAADAAFGEVVRLLDDGDLTLDEGAKADMRLVVQGFLDLSKAARAVPPPTPVPTLPVEPAGAPATAPATAPPSTTTPAAPPQEKPASQPPAATGDPIYDNTATDVVPPLPLRQSVTIPQGARPPEVVEGVVEIVIDRDGEIETAVVRQPFGSTLDGLVLQSVKNWRYRPGTRDGKPVRYRRLVRIVLPSR